MDFNNITGLTIPEGEVVEISSQGEVLWSAGGRIPSKYQEVEYIKAAAGVGAYIDLGFAFDEAAIIQVGIYLDAANEKINAYPFGAAEADTGYQCMITAPVSTNTANRLYVYGMSNSKPDFLPVEYVADAVNRLHFWLNMGGDAIYARNETARWGIHTEDNEELFTMTSNLYLFAQNYNGAARFGGDRQIHYFNYYDKTGTLISCLVPCYRKSDGVIGMYDNVRDIFLFNVGSGAFTKGADV